MSKGIKIVILFIALVLIFNKKIVSYFILYGISEWTNRTIVLDKIQINYSQSLITIHDLRKMMNGGTYDGFCDNPDSPGPKWVVDYLDKKQWPSHPSLSGFA